MKVHVFTIRQAAGYLQQDLDAFNNFLSQVNVVKTAEAFQSGPDNSWSVLVYYTEKSSRAAASQGGQEKISFDPKTTLEKEEQRIFNELKKWRADKASETGLPAYTVCTDAELVAVSKVKPKDPEDLLAIKGFGQQKVAKFGIDIVALLESIR